MIFSRRSKNIAAGAVHLTAIFCVSESLFLKPELKAYRNFCALKLQKYVSKVALLNSRMNLKDGSRYVYTGSVENVSCY